MATLKFPNPKDPSSELDYIMDWSDFLQGDAIDSSVWQIPADLTDGGDAFNDTVTTIWLSDGEPGNTYTLSNKITTVGGRTAERDVKLKVSNR